MKKEYISPMLFLIAEPTDCILGAASGTITTNGDTATVTPGQGEYGGNDWASRRQKSVWGDEEDDF